MKKTWNLFFLHSFIWLFLIFVPYWKQQIGPQKLVIVFYVCSIPTCHEGYVAAAYFWFRSANQEKNQAYGILQGLQRCMVSWHWSQLLDNGSPQRWYRNLAPVQKVSLLPNVRRKEFVHYMWVFENMYCKLRPAMG